MSKKKEYPWTDKPAGKIAVTIIKAQTKFSNAVNSKLNKLSIKRLKIVLVIFCMIWGGLSIYFIAFEKKTTPRPARVKLISQPEDQAEYKVDPDIIEQIHAYKRYMDSLGEPIRPSLLDSMQVLEQIFLQQQK